MEGNSKVVSDSRDSKGSQKGKISRMSFREAFSKFQGRSTALGRKIHELDTSKADDSITKRISDLNNALQQVRQKAINENRDVGKMQDQSLIEASAQTIKGLEDEVKNQETQFEQLKRDLEKISMAKGEQEKKNQGK